MESLFKFWGNLQAKEVSGQKKSAWRYIATCLESDIQILGTTCITFYISTTKVQLCISIWSTWNGKLAYGDKTE